MSQKQSKWILAPVPEMPPDVDSSMPEVLVRMLLQRGVPTSDMDAYLHPRLKLLQDPFMLPDMELAVTRILGAVDDGQEVCVYGDYDVDGITSVTLLSTVLRAYGLQVRSFIPKRGPEGYGLNEAALQRCMSEGNKPDLLITVDCGTASLDEIADLKSDGIDVIVVDHHEMSPDGRPDCEAVINPKCAQGTSHPFDYLCAAGVVFKLAHALLKTRAVAGFDLKDYLDLVAMATISDIVPLVEENRLLVRHGLKRMSQSRNLGITALMEVAQVKGPLTSADVGFRIGPRINAAGRMDKPEDALAMLTTQDATEAQNLAETLDSHNRARQAEELRIHKEAVHCLEAECDPSDPVIVLGSRDWHPGVVGIVASRMMRRFHKPAFIIAIDEHGIGKGSGRSIQGISLMDAINANRDLLVAGGGHAMAAGISVKEGDIVKFREAFASYVKEHISKDDLSPRLHIDTEISLGELSLEFLSSYELLQPFGSANPEPLFMSSGVQLTDPPRELKNHHLKLSMQQDGQRQEAMFFGGGQHELPSWQEPWDIAYTINRNTFRGRTSLQLIIQDVRPHQS